MDKRSFPPPLWAMHTAKPGDRDAAMRAFKNGNLKTNWDVVRFRGVSYKYAGKQGIDGPPIDWAKSHGWPIPLFTSGSTFITRMLISLIPGQDAGELFLTKMLENDENFDLAVIESGAKVYFPKEHHDISESELKSLDAMYNATKKMGALGRRPTRWGSLVEELREIRRAVEAGVVVTVDGKTLTDFNSFYTWAHGRYHALEDGYDSWIGDDES